MEELIVILLKSGPGFVLAGVLLWLYVGKVRDYREAVEKLYGIIRETVASDQQHRATIEEAARALVNVDRRLEDLGLSVRRIDQQLDRGDLTGPHQLPPATGGDDRG